jgi:hypothetical protein
MAGEGATLIENRGSINDFPLALALRLEPQ